MTDIRRLAPFILALTFATSHAQPASIDTILTAYRLKPPMETDFAADGKMSPFWKIWDDHNVQRAGMLDAAYLTVRDNGWTTGARSFSGPDDARMDIRAAYGLRGLYLYFLIHDNCWIPSASPDSDAIDFMLDRLSSREILSANPYDLFVQPTWGWAITYYTVQYGLNIGAGRLPGFMTGNYYDGSAMSYNRIPLPELTDTMQGMSIDMQTIDATHQAIEWFIPWKWVGRRSDSIPGPGTRFAFRGGYNDLDSGENRAAGLKALRWESWDRTQCGLLGNPGPGCRQWNDIELGPMLETLHQPASAVSPRPVASGRTIRTASSGVFALNGACRKPSAVRQSRTPSLSLHVGTHSPE